jgi:hypothetical protein
MSTERWTLSLSHRGSCATEFPEFLLLSAAALIVLVDEQAHVVHDEKEDVVF